MKGRHLLATAVMAFGLCAPVTARAQSAVVDETQPTAEAVTAVTNHWSDAEARGDTAWLERLLAPEYRSVNADGTIHSRSRIIAGAAAHGSPAAVAALATWRATHHHNVRVVIDHETAVVSYSPGPDGPDAPITSSDIFVYRDHHWQALYSAHTTLKS
jgi:hypothetical protein